MVTPTNRQPTVPASPANLSPGRQRLIRLAISFWLVYHVSAIVIAPASVSPASSLVQSVWLVFQPYLQLLYLNNGYHFFAPEPAESTLLAYKAERRRRHRRRGAHSQPPDRPAITLPPSLHADRADEFRAARPRRAVVSLVRGTHRPQIRRQEGDLDAAASLPANDGDGPGWDQPS